MLEENIPPTGKDFVESFFKQGPVGNVAGKMFERDIGAFLLDCGYSPFMHEEIAPSSAYSLKFFEIVDISSNSDKTVGEVDGMVSGNADAYRQLLDKSPLYYIPVSPVPPSSMNTHILAVEAKLTADSFVKAVVNRKPGTTWWLTNKSLHPFLFKVLIFNGGKKSAAFFDKSSIEEGSDIQKAWQFVEDNDIYVFHMPSFSLEWIRDLSKKSDEIIAKYDKMALFLKSLGYDDKNF